MQNTVTTTRGRPAVQRLIEQILGAALDELLQFGPLPGAFSAYGRHNH